MTLDPRIRDSIDNMARVSSEQASGAQGNLVLVVEDEPNVRDIAQSTLQRHGYQVITAEDGVSGLAAFTQYRDSIRVVLIDTLMPRMTGLETVRAIRQLDERMPIISITGCPDPEVTAAFEALNVTAFLPKPYRQAELLGIVAAVTQGAGASE